MGAKEISTARAALAATIANEARLNGGVVAPDNPYVQKAKQRVAAAEEEAERANRWWEDD